MAAFRFRKRHLKTYAGVWGTIPCILMIDMMSVAVLEDKSTCQAQSAESELPREHCAHHPLFFGWLLLFGLLFTGNSRQSYVNVKNVYQI